MVTQTEIFVEGFKLDISDDNNSLLTFAIDDVRDFSSRQTTFSKTVVIPGTANNNRIFGDIFDTGISNGYVSTAPNVGINFNASKSARCLIFQDNLQTFKGTIRLLEIDIDKKRIEYEVAMNGDLTNLSVALSSSLLEDLDFSAYDRNYTLADIVASWDNTPGSGVYYPLIDYGTYSAGKHDWDIRTFRPALYVKEFIDKMFAACGYRYTSTLFNTDAFKRLVIPYNKKIFQGFTNEEFSASRTDNSNWLDQASSSFTRPITFNTFNGTLFSISSSGAVPTPNSKFTYIGTDPLLAHFTFSAGNIIQRATHDFYIEVWLNGVAVALTTQKYAQNGSAFTGFYSYSSAFDYTIQPGDTLQLVARCDGMAGGDLDFMQVNNAGIGCTSVASVLAPVGVGDFFKINQGIPSNVRQVDLLVSIVKLFNLYVTESQFDENSMVIEPFINFYNPNASATVDWTYKMDRDGAIKITPMSEVNFKLYNFNYAADTDYWNDLYNKRYNQVYGSYIFDSQFEFASQDTTLELIFAPTPLVGYQGEDKVYPTIFKRTGVVTGAGEETLDSVIRIMTTKKIFGITPWSIKDGATVLGSYPYYGYAGHFDDPDNPMTDLNFGALYELFFLLVTPPPQKTQFNVYWSAYMAEITDKDSKLLSAQFYLKPSDIFRLSFSHYVYLDGSLYRLNKIIDYNSTQPALCTVELLKVINTTYQFVNFPPVIDSNFWLWKDGGYFLQNNTDKIIYQ